MLLFWARGTFWNQIVIKRPAEPTWLENLLSNQWLGNLWAITAAFGTYFCMYMYRKPFTAAGFKSETLGSDAVGDWDQKAVLVSAQVIGYLLSKIIGIRVVSEAQRQQRAWIILGLILSALGSLLLFALVPRSWQAPCMFLNGLPLGMVFGLVLGSLEGRRMTEALAAGLCASFILAGGVSKTVGQSLIDQTQKQLHWSLGDSERWMPFFAGLLFLLPICIFVWMLHRIPPPTQLDQVARSPRDPMRKEDRWRILKTYTVGICAVALMYLVVSILRSFRDDFAREILTGLGATIKSVDYANIDFWVMLVATLANGAAVLVKDNRKALQLAFATCLAGFGILLATVLGHRYWFGLSPTMLMVLIGAGLYLPYVAVHTTVFERIIACTRDRANVGFMMYVADSVGYLGFAILILAKNFFIGQIEEKRFAELFLWICMIGAIASIFAVVIALRKFRSIENRSV
jgi:MFS family permease